MTDFHDDITQPPQTSVRVPTTQEGGGSGPGGSTTSEGGGTPGGSGPGPRGGDGVIDRDAIRRRLREDEGGTQAMEVVNEDEGDEPVPEPAPEPAPEPEILEYGPEEVPNEADDPDFVGPLPTDNDDKEWTAEQLRQYGEELLTDNPDATFGMYPVDEGGGMLNYNPDEVMAPLDEDGRPIDGGDDFGGGGLNFG